MVKLLIRLGMLHCYNNKVLIILLAFVIGTNAFGQTQMTRKQRQLMFKGDKKFDIADYPHALKIYKELLPIDSLSYELNYKIGVCTFEDKKTRIESKKYFFKTSSEKYPETTYYLGKIYHIEGNFDKSIDYFHSYIKIKGEKEHTIKEVEDLVEKCYYSKLQMQTPQNEVKIFNLGSNINTEYAEYAPLIPASENALYFTSRRKNPIWNNLDVFDDFYEDIYVSYRNLDSTWGKPTIMDTIINSSYHDAATGLSADGEKLLIYHTSEDHVHGHIYISELENEKWIKPHKLDANINSAHHNETSACFSPDGEIIFFSSDRPGGYGGKDLYSIKKAPSGKWAKAMNLGPMINTEYNEDAPFIHPHDSVLFFSSEGHQNMGGYDIFKSNFDEAEHFTTPKNLGYPVNTIDDDIFFVLNASGSTGYMSSKRNDGYGLYDIYGINFSINNAPMNVYNLHVYDESSKEVIKKVEVVVTNIDKKTISGIYKSNSLTGKTILISKPEQSYRIAIQAVGYEPLILDNYFLNNETSINFKLVRKQHD